jgi:selenocysteine-specific elongation factor
VIVGTAGHIDHGKTALVKALTGVDTDRLPEEKRRGITIDLGFAPMIVDGIGTVGVVDVPGHEAFIRTMLAGATGIDVALLVIAADEGVMPQTTEHLEILSLLRIPSAVVALTKSDLVSPEWLALVADDVRSLLADTHFAESELIPVSAVTGKGLDELRGAIARASKTIAIRSGARGDLFRMPVDRTFTIRGTGTVVTGTVWSGTIGRDATVTVYPPGKKSRVRGLQHHGTAVSTVGAGERVALALADIEVGEVGRGSVVIADDAWLPTSRLHARVRLTSDDVEITPRTRLRFHLGTADVGARIRRHSAEHSDVDGTFAATVILEEPLIARGEDRFVLRLPSPARTIGGGIVSDPYPPLRRKRRSARSNVLPPYDASELTPREPIDEKLLDMAADAGLEGLDASTLPIRLGIVPAESGALVERVGLMRIQRAVFHPAALADLEATIEAAILDHVENYPMELGVQLQSLRAMIRAPDAVIDAVVDRLLKKSRIAIRGSALSPAGWSPRLGDRDQALADSIMHEICTEGAEPPAVSELVTSYGGGAQAVLRYLERAGRLVKVSDDRYYSPEAVETMVGKLKSSLEPGRTYSPSELREVLGVSRKYLIPFLEFCDITGVTDRKAEGRVITNRARAGRA